MEKLNKKKPISVSKDIRLSWDDYFIKITALVSERSTCLRHHVGAIIVKDRRVLTTGYNGAPANTKDCLELGCLRDQLNIPSGERHEICRAIHAEQNAIIQASKHGENIQDSTLYCTHSPCIICTKMMINAGIKRIVTYGNYPDIGGVRDLLKEAGIELCIVNRPSDKIIFLD
ncbi:MAG: cytidine/deoxycytidylate deaminase family protein [Candidatus Shapirobacteria bacterium]